MGEFSPILIASNLSLIQFQFKNSIKNVLYAYFSINANKINNLATNLAKTFIFEGAFGRQIKRRILRYASC